MASFNTLIELPTGEEIEVCVEFDYSPVIPARVNCLPEDATPEEGGECSINEVVNVETGDYIDLSTLSIKDNEWLEEKAKENVEQAEIDLKSSHEDYQYEMEKDRRMCEEEN